MTAPASCAQPFYCCWTPRTLGSCPFCADASMLSAEAAGWLQRDRGWSLLGWISVFHSSWFDDSRGPLALLLGEGLCLKPSGHSAAMSYRSVLDTKLEEVWAFDQAQEGETKQFSSVKNLGGNLVLRSSARPQEWPRPLRSLVLLRKIYSGLIPLLITYPSCSPATESHVSGGVRQENGLWQTGFPP